MTVQIIRLLYLWHFNHQHYHKIEVYEDSRGQWEVPVRCY